MDSAGKKNLYDEIEKKTGVISTPTEVKEFSSLIASGFPLQLYVVWKESCKSYNDIHWAKIWSDHLKAQAYDMIVNSSVQHSEPVEDKEKDENEISLIGDPEETENGKV